MKGAFVSRGSDCFNRLPLRGSVSELPLILRGRGAAEEREGELKGGQMWKRGRGRRTGEGELRGVAAEGEEGS